MIKAVLLDLDDTLLHNPDKTFVPVYLSKFEAHLREGVGSDNAVGAIRGTVRVMAKPHHPQQTNLEAASAHLATKLERPLGKIQPHVDTFYRDVFPSLQRLTKPVNSAPELLAELRTRGLKVVIATNPLYPATAICQRLGWAGLSPHPTDYALITTADVMHFIKPDPGYYAEILARIGVEPEEAIMVGNSITNDIEPASQMGMYTYHISDGDRKAGSGTLSDFLAEVQRDWLGDLTERVLKPPMIIPELTANVAALFGLLRAVEPHQWATHPSHGEWNILQIVCHLLNREERVHRARLTRIYEENNPFIGIPPPDNPPGAGCAEDGLRIAREFAAERDKTLRFLESLPQQAWYAPAQHSIFSNTTLLEMAHFTAQHDRMHLAQLRETLAQAQ